MKYMVIGIRSQPHLSVRSAAAILGRGGGSSSNAFLEGFAHSIQKGTGATAQNLNDYLGQALGSRSVTSVSDQMMETALTIRKVNETRTGIFRRMTDAPFPSFSWVSEPSKTPPRRKEIPVALQAEPEIRRHAKDPSRSQDRIGRYRSALDDLVEPGERRRRSAEFLLVCETRLVLFLPGSNSPFVESFQGGVCEFADLRLTMPW